MAAACSCRSRTLSTFVQFVTQIHIPNKKACKATTAGGSRTLRTASGPNNTAYDAVHQSASADAHKDKVLRSPSTNADAQSETRYEEQSRRARKECEKAEGQTCEFRFELRARQLAMPHSRHRCKHHRTTPRGVLHSRSSIPRSRLLPRRGGTISKASEGKGTARHEEGKRAIQARQGKERSSRRKAERHQEWLQESTAWAIQKDALKKKFPEGWAPRKRLSPDALNGIRALHQQFPDMYTTETLANKFEVSPEAIRRILKPSGSPAGRRRRTASAGGTIAAWRCGIDTRRSARSHLRSGEMQALPSGLGEA
ncbi:hypothetical protein OPQ81_005372 [Rhizoctonia solani]|nr:hypothetical protein OPQ81_005372 [Rhizoctonia solani]